MSGQAASSVVPRENLTLPDSELSECLFESDLPPTVARAVARASRLGGASRTAPAAEAVRGQALPARRRQVHS